MAEKGKNRYTRLIEDIFRRHYKEGASSIEFDRSELSEAARRLKIKLPKNLGDVLYTFRYRATLPSSIIAKTPPGKMWILRPAGRGRYRLELTTAASISPSPMLIETKVPDATPGVITKYAQSDEQALLAIIRYNRLVDIFTGLACYSLQNHLRTTVPGLGQVETDEIYIGIDKRGVHYVIPVQAKGRSEKIGIVQIEQDMALCAARFPDLVCRSVAAQFMKGDLIALFELARSEEGVAISSERHYKLVRPEELSSEELRAYQQRPVE
ncbi:MAG: endonuclease [Chloroflexi bacterium]|nr:endonuclease [Chloroflexota bacterium]